MRVMGRATQGVRLITLKNNEHIAAVAKVNKEEEELPKEMEDSTETIDENRKDNNQES